MNATKKAVSGSLIRYQIEGEHDFGIYVPDDSGSAKIFWSNWAHGNTRSEESWERSFGEKSTLTVAIR